MFLVESTTSSNFSDDRVEALTGLVAIRCLNYVTSERPGNLANVNIDLRLAKCHLD